MKTIITIFKKEMLDTLRDRRTLIMMVVIPVMLFPVMMGIIIKVQTRQFKKAAEKTLRVALATYGNAEEFRDSLLARQDLEVRENIETEEVERLIRQDSLDAAFLFSRDFDSQVAGMKQGIVEFYFKSTEDQNISRSRLRRLVNSFEKRLVTDRFTQLELDEKIVDAVRIQEHDIATIKEVAGKTIGGFLPYIFVIFCFMGGLYPAIDLAAGEKERGTLETLLSSPASRFQIVIGKFSVVVLAGLFSAAISIVGLFIAVMQFKAVGLPQEINEIVSAILDPVVIALMFSLLLPLSMFFAAVMLSLSIFAKSFKEAQSLITPLNIVVIVPVLIGLLPGIELDAKTALIPILNVSLATKEIIAGTIRPVFLAEAYISSIILAGLSLYGCTKWFERENTLFRG